ncbi:uncharacterized protein LOC113868107 [Abrus precatorius]|uniref:Uncharacterized protein LOC113868107 n=1 Tax=Abrus precatorius TaxID=3816 RepID=A0A8B8LX47_ABRPR|nr:uncharacterized protein LOC113868107 [Abrus precatorius]
MSTNTKHSYKLCVRRATRRRRKQHQPQKRNAPTPSKFGFMAHRSFKPIEGKCKSKLSQKLQALKSLIPTHNGNTVKPDQLFKETADYIVLLRTRVVVLQKLIEYYGNNTEDDNVVLL